MKVIVVFLGASVLIVAVDVLIWERINFIRNFRLSEDEKLPLLYRPVFQNNHIQIASWVAIASLMTACNFYLRSSAYGPIVVITLVAYAAHLILTVRRYQRLYAAGKMRGQS